MINITKHLFQNSVKYFLSCSFNIISHFVMNYLDILLSFHVYSHNFTVLASKVLLLLTFQNFNYAFRRFWDTIKYTLLPSLYLTHWRGPHGIFCDFFYIKKIGQTYPKFTQNIKHIMFFNISTWNISFVQFDCFHEHDPK